ncbi:MAG: IS21 family transposase [Thermoleophilia bacterium]|nr:IS21 family transposase [Thermoleophilia bacterium]
MEWVKVRELVAMGLSQRQVARQLGMNRRTVARLAASPEPPRYEREPAGSALDLHEPLMREVLAEWPRIHAPRMTEILRGHGFEGSERVVRRRLRELRPPVVRAAQRTGYAPGQVAQIDWAEMDSRPRILGAERRIYALVLTLPYSGAQTAHFSFDMTVESFLEGHVAAFEFLGGVPGECVYDNLRSAVARREGDQIRWAHRFSHLRGHYAFSAHACTPATPREKGSVESGVRYLKTSFWPARRIRDLVDLDEQYAHWRDRIANVRIHATGRFPVGERLAAERAALRALPPGRFDPAGERQTRVPIDGYLKHAGSFYRAPPELVHQRVDLRFSRDEVWICHRGVEVARYARSYQAGTWLPAPVMRPVPPPPPAPAILPAIRVAAPELAPYAELCR